MVMMVPSFKMVIITRAMTGSVKTDSSELSSEKSVEEVPMFRCLEGK